MKCPCCEDGKVKVFPRKNKGEVLSTVMCNDCGGTGKLDITKAQYDEWKDKGEMLKEDRIARKLTLLLESRRLNIDVARLSRMERGLECPDEIY